MTKLIILAAGEGKRLKPYTLDMPKCLVKLHGKSILDWQIDAARQLHINDIIVVKGYKQEISVAVDKDWLSYWKMRFNNPLEDAESLRVAESGQILEVGQKSNDIRDIQGQFIGLIRFKREGIEFLNNFYMMSKEAASCGKKIFRCTRHFKNIFMTDFLQGMIDFGYKIFEVPIKRNWCEFDSPLDYKIA